MWREHLRQLWVALGRNTPAFGGAKVGASSSPLWAAVTRIGPAFDAANADLLSQEPLDYLVVRRSSNFGPLTVDASYPRAARSHLFEDRVPLRQRPDLVGAEDAFRRAVEQGGIAAALVEYVDALNDLGDLVRKRDWAGAEDALRRAGQAGGGDALLDLADTFRAIRRAGEGVDGLVEFGTLLRSRGDLVGAEDAFRRAGQGGSVDGLIELGTLLRSRGDLVGAEDAFRRAVDQGGGSVDAFAELWDLLRVRGDLAGAEATLRLAIERSTERATSEDPDALVGLAKSFRERSDSPATVRALDHALRAAARFRLSPEAERQGEKTSDYGEKTSD